MNRPPRKVLRALVTRPGILLRLRRLGRLEVLGGSPVVFGNRVEVISDGRQAFDAMLEAIAGARRSIALEMYIWADDRLGRRFVEAVAAKAREGIPVRALVDAFGSWEGTGMLADLEARGVDLRWYHPLAPWTPRWYPNRRNHRKVLIVDGAIGFAGGMNLAESHSAEFAGAEAWRDLVLRLEGPVVREMARRFVETWGRTGGDLAAAGDLAPPLSERGKSAVQILGGRSFRDRRSLKRVYLRLIRAARQRIFVAHAYFVPERSIRRALEGAARRGVAVDLLLPGRSDVPLVRWASRAGYEGLLAAGARVRELETPVLHAKVAIFDGEVLATGSANLDSRSFRHNVEIGVNVIDRESAAAALRSLEAEWDRAAPVTAETWSRRGTGERLKETLGRALAYWL